MGVHDYACLGCGEPGTYSCAEGSGGHCEQTGIGEETALVSLFFFPPDAVPADEAAFVSQRATCTRNQTLLFGYDWGEWEFKPSLCYRDILMDDEPTGVWRVIEEGEEGPLEFDLGGAAAWAAVWCPRCYPLLVLGTTPPSEVCNLHYAAMAELHPALSFEPGSDKQAFVTEARALLGDRFPLDPPAEPARAG